MHSSWPRSPHSGRHPSLPNAAPRRCDGNPPTPPAPLSRNARPRRQQSSRQNPARHRQGLRSVLWLLLWYPQAVTRQKSQFHTHFIILLFNNSLAATSPALVRRRIQQWTQLLGNCFPGAENTAAHGADRTIHRICNLVVAQPLDLAQRDGSTQFFRQCLHRHVDRLSNLLGGQHRFRSVDVPQMVCVVKSFRFFCIGFSGRGRPSAHGDQIILGGIDANAIKPGIEGRIATELRQRTIGLDKGFLHHVFGFGLVAYQPRHQAHQLALILDYQQLERLLVATLDALNKLLVNFAFCRQTGFLVFYGRVVLSSLPLTHHWQMLPARQFSSLPALFFQHSCLGRIVTDQPPARHGKCAESIFGNRIRKDGNGTDRAVFQAQAQQQHARPDGTASQQLGQASLHDLRFGTARRRRQVFHDTNLPGAGDMQPDRLARAQGQPKRNGRRQDADGRQRSTRQARQRTRHPQGYQHTGQGHAQTGESGDQQEQAGRFDIRGDRYRHTMPGCQGLIKMTNPASVEAGLCILHLADDQGAVGSPETEGVLHGNIDLHVPRLVGAVIQIAFRILVEDVHRRRGHLIVQRQHGQHRLQATGATQKVTGHGFGRIDNHLVGMVAESGLDRVGLVLVAQRGRRAVRVQILHFIRIDTGIAQCIEHAATRTIQVGCSHVVSITAHAEAQQFSIDLGTTGLGVFVLFEHHHAGALAQHETIAILVPGTGGGCGVVVAGRQGAGRRETTNTQRRNTGFGAAGNHRICVTVHDHARGRADAMQAGGAGSDDRQVRPLQAELDGQVARDHVDDRGRDKERTDAARTTVGQFGVGFFDQRQAANARTDHDANALGILVRYRQSAILDGLDTGGHAVVDEGIHMTRFFGGDVILDIEALYLTGKMRGEGGSVELGHGSDAGLAFLDGTPRIGDVVADRRDASQAGNDYTTFTSAAQAILLKLLQSPDQALTCDFAQSIACCTVVIFSACSSGISISNSSSSAMTSSTVSSESAPRSSTNDDSFLMSASATPSCSATIFFTRCSISDIVFLQRDDRLQKCAHFSRFARGKFTFNYSWQDCAKSSITANNRRQKDLSQALRTCSTHVHAAIHIECGTGDVGRLRRRQEGHRIGNLLGRAQATQRDLLQDGGGLLFVQGLGHVGIDEAGRHAVHGDVAAADLTRQRATHASHAGLGGGIVHLARIAGLAHHRGDADDAAGTGLHHATQHGTGEATDSGEVGGDDAIPFLILHAHGQLVLGDAGIVDQDGERSEFLLHLLHHGHAGLGVIDVEHHAATGFRTQLSQVFRDGGSTRLGGSGADHARALAGQLGGDGAADATGCAGHQRDLSLQILCTHLSSSNTLSRDS
eukprot:TRINITY_DN979_c0_g7_i1.p1 TRINITY_DN979_c0_g7~~TRINITY_DN979_c0_g7_i1.p1  ORF type:complete len:1344 (+),score=262.78 TRINITY_DN979_c0_g7_i1:3504-7535(+)